MGKSNHGKLCRTNAKGFNLRMWESTLNNALHKTCLSILYIGLFWLSALPVRGEIIRGDTLSINPITFMDQSPVGWNAQYKTIVDFPDDHTEWSKILMIQTLKCDSATAGDQYPCGEWDYIWNTIIKVPVADSIETFTLGSFVTPYGKRLNLGGKRGWVWTYDITEYAPLLRGERELITGNNQELLDLKFLFIKGKPARTVLSVENIYPYADYRYEHLATDSLLKEKEVVLSREAQAFSLKAIISGHGHAGPRNCCEWDSKTHSYVINRWHSYRWKVWKDCGNNPIYPQGGTWPFDRAGWCPGTKVDEYEFEITSKVNPGDTVLIDYEIENFKDNGEEAGTFRMSHQLFSYGPPNSKHDAAMVEIISPNRADRYSRQNPDCGSPIIRVQNQGRYPLKNLTIKYGVSGSRKRNAKWQGNLEFLESEIITLPSLPIKKLKKSQTFEVEIMMNKNIADENKDNNWLSSHYGMPKVLPEHFELVIHTNNLGRSTENRFIINDASGMTWYYEDSFEDSTAYRFPIELARGCYQFKFMDDQEDGISKHWWNRSAAPDQVGMNGLVQLESLSGDTLVTFPADFGQEILLNFIVE